MDRVNHDWNAGALGGQTPENPRFAAVSVDDVRFLFAENFFELFERAMVLNRPHRADQFGHHCHQAGNGGYFSFHRAFGSGGWAGNQPDFDPGISSQSHDGGDGILLRAADDQPRNDVNDPHSREVLSVNCWRGCAPAAQCSNDFNRSATVFASSVLVRAWAR